MWSQKESVRLRSRYRNFFEREVALLKVAAEEKQSETTAVNLH
jgi:phosphatidate phosphatase APP1